MIGSKNFICLVMFTDSCEAKSLAGILVDEFDDLFGTTACFDAREKWS